MMALFGLTATGVGLAAGTFTHAAIGSAPELAVPIYAAHGNMAHAVTDGIEGIGGKAPQPPEGGAKQQNL